MPVGGNAPPKRFPNSTSFDGGAGGFQGNQSANARHAGPEAARSGGFGPQLETPGGFRQGNVRPPAKAPTKSSNNDPRTLGSNAFPPGNQQSAATFQAGGVGADGYQYGVGGGAGAYKGAEVSGVYQTSYGTGRMYGASEGYQPPGDMGTASLQQPASNLQQPGTSMNYQQASAAYQPATTTAASSMYSGATFQANAGAAFSDPNFMAGYYGGYAGAVGSVQGYGYEYMAGYQMPTGTTADPNYNMSAYQNSGYYPGYDYTQANAAAAAAAAAATMANYASSNVAGSAATKTTW